MRDKTNRELMNNLSPETIAYIVEWAESGNEPRQDSELAKWCCAFIGTYARPEWRLSPAGFTIAAQAKRIRELEEKLDDQESTTRGLVLSHQRQLLEAHERIQELKAERAEAWDKGLSAGEDAYFGVNRPNPYRKDSDD